MSITKSAVLEVLEKVVAESGPNTYANCVYVEAGQPHCIAGKVFAELGADILLLSKLDDAFGSLSEYGPVREPSQYVTAGPQILEDAIGLEFEPDAYKVIAMAQKVQDSASQNSWGEALNAARKV